jgi:hypothetical protein
MDSGGGATRVPQKHLAAGAVDYVCLLSKSVKEWRQVSRHWAESSVGKRDPIHYWQPGLIRTVTQCPARSPPRQPAHGRGRPPSGSESFTCFCQCQWRTPVCVGCLFLRSPSRVPYRTELPPRAPKGRSLARCVFITAVPITKLFAAGGGGGEWRTCATRDESTVGANVTEGV